MTLGLRFLVIALLSYATIVYANAQWTVGSDFPVIHSYECEIEALAVDPGVSNTLYAGTFNGCGVWKSIDGGQTWANALSNKWVNDIAIQPSNSQAVLAATESGLCRSDDAGTLWLCSNTAGSIRSVAFSQSNPNIVYRAASGVSKSFDGGRSWTAVSDPGGGEGGYYLDGQPFNPKSVYRVVVDPSDASTVYAWVYLGYIFKSVDGGATWMKLYRDFSDDGYGPRTIALNPTNRNEVWIGKSAGVLRTRDAGVTWQTALANPEPQYRMSVAVDQLNPLTAYASTGTKGMWITRDGGETWTEFAPQLRFAGRNGIVLSSTVPRKLAVEYGSKVASISADPGYQVVEFYNAALDHYFITAYPQEIELLDNGTLRGWTRTGQVFNATAATQSVDSRFTSVCRFYGSPSAGLDSHFYSASPAECNDVRERFAGKWIFESDNVFIVSLPDPVTGNCAPGRRPLYRLFNGRADANHRYTTSLAIRNEMVGRGYIPEGYGPVGATMCVQ
jgi:photosystem II stability/assembly factor-like uncharacterized protein